MPDLATLGWDEGWSKAFAEHAADGLVPGRVAVPHRGAYDVLTEEGETRARLPGRARHDAESLADLPVVGDWVAIEPPGQDSPAIRAVLPRRTKFSRLAAHDPGAEVTREQVIAANIDVVFIVASLADDPNPRQLERYLTLARESGARPVILLTTSLNEDLNLRRLERYLATAWNSGADPVILLTKADLDDDPAAVVARLADFGDVAVHAVSSRSTAGLDDVRAYLAPGVTAALLGPSGVGKSTLVNALAGEELLATGAVRDDGSGRHTTTRRELIILPGGGIVVDNPGMRELHLWLAGDGLEETFEDIVELESRCRFSDCSHEGEPGCAIQAALADGTLAPERWESFRMLQRELAELDARLARRERSRARRGRPGAEDS